MNLLFYWEKLEDSSAFAEFKKKYPKAYFMAGFFVIDLKDKKDSNQLDFYIPEEKKIASFNMNGEIVYSLHDLLKDEIPEELDPQTTTSLDDLHLIIEMELKSNKITNKIEKIIAILHNIKGKKIWSVSCALSGLSILRSTIQDEDQKVLKFEKASIFDFVKKQ